jgi:hypothetical protein
MISFGSARRPLGYTLRLKDFTRVQNPGNIGNASFTSLVEVSDPSAAETSAFEIGMNRPLRYGKYTLYQASFEDSGHGKAASVLSVGYDPGRFLKYLGSAMICSGIFTMFFMRAYFFSKVPRWIGGIGGLPREPLPASPGDATELSRRAA